MTAWPQGALAQARAIKPTLGCNPNNTQLQPIGNTWLAWLSWAQVRDRPDSVVMVVMLLVLLRQQELVQCS